MLTLSKRRRVNIMLDVNLIDSLNELVPAGDRSDVINQAIEEKMTQLSRQKASEFMEEMRKKLKHKTTTRQILKDIRYGRK